MKWTKKKPAKPGWYWMWKSDPYIARIDWSNGVLSMTNDPDRDIPVIELNVEFAGPIPEPKEKP